MKKLLCANDVKSAADQGLKSLQVDSATIITPSAKDLAKELKVEICWPQRSVPAEKTTISDNNPIRNSSHIKNVTNKKQSQSQKSSDKAEGRDTRLDNYDYDLQSVQETRFLARQGKQAQSELAKFDSEQIEKIIRNMVKAAEENALALAQLAVEETGFGKVEDKVFKNRFASTELYEFIKPMRTIGIIREDTVKKVTEIAEPVGLLMGIIPSTNPTSTVIYKAIIALKARNGIVFSPHPSALRCTLQAAILMHDAAVAAGAPKHIIGCISKPSMQATNELMKCDEVAMIIATGGSAMVKAAYSAGKPALGVGPGNVPAYIERTADIVQAVKNIIASKTFDYGTICASEQAVIVDECIANQVREEFKRRGGYFMSATETEKVAQKLFNKGYAMNAKMVGRSAEVIAKGAGISVPSGTKVLLGDQQGVGEGYPLSYEKLTTVLAFYAVKDWQEACDLSIRLLNNGGVGHSISIHTENSEIAMKFSEKPVFRILVNTSSSQGGVGASTGLAPAFTLGCGTWGGSATSDNVTPLHLINIKRVAYGIKNFTETTDSSDHPDIAALAESISSLGSISEERLQVMIQEVLSLLKKRGDA